MNAIFCEKDIENSTMAIRNNDIITVSIAFFGFNRGLKNKKNRYNVDYSTL